MKQSIGAKHLANQLLFRLHNHGCKLIVSSELCQTIIYDTWFLHREQTVPLQNAFASISINGTDKIQLVDFPDNFKQVVLDAVKNNWSKGIKNIRTVKEMLVVKLKGRPWNYNPNDVIRSKDLLKRLINELLSHHWVLYGSTNLRGNADTLIFKYDPNIENRDPFKIGFILTSYFYDRLCLHDAPPEVIDAVRATLRDEDEGGILRERQKFTRYEFKMSGYPWCGCFSSSVSSRYLLCKIFERLVAIGWRVQLGIGLIEKEEGKSIFAFVPYPPSPLKVMCISLNSTNTMRLINFPEDIMEPFLEEIEAYWQFGVSRFELHYGVPEIKFDGNPWRCDVMGHDHAHGCSLIAHIIRKLATMGWYLTVAADVSSNRVIEPSGVNYPRDVDSLWFIQLYPPPIS